MPLSDTRKTILEIVNEVRRKIGVGAVTSLTQDSMSRNAVDYLNDVVSEISDYGDWQEMLVETLVTASSSVIDYLITSESTASVVKNIHEIAFYQRISSMYMVTLDDIRRLQRTNTVGVPTQWAIVGVDNTNTGNPYFRVYPTPSTGQNNQTFNVLYYKKPRLYTTDDANITIEFPSRMIVQGLLAATLRDESRGTPEIAAEKERALFEKMLEETYNQFNGDSGSDTFFKPPYTRARQ